MLSTASKRGNKYNRIKQLRAFCCTAQYRSVSKAAQRLCLSQPSVSLQIQALERELGITLFERRGPRIRLTPDGETLYELAQPLVEGIDALPERFAAHNENLQSGRLDIAAGESTALYLLPDLIGRFMTLHPGMHVKLHNLAGKPMCHAIRHDEVDFAIGSMLDLPEDISYRAIYCYSLSLITPLDHPLARKRAITLQDLASSELIVPPRHLTTWRLINLVFQQHSIPYKARLEVGGWEIIKRYVELGFGIAIASNLCLSGFEKLAVRPLPEVFPKRTYGIMVRHGKFLSLQAKRFIELMRPESQPTDRSAPRLHPNASVFIAADEA
ncbi:LysR family transcriptional regulator [Nitrococcus mobilis]|uniref:Transcriptional regulator, LysR family protein n=1 Tax=Nitrococcus mobilis Nb-231 TaxID=314278 RepID=A4BTH5_9GAMM|nr:LysR family transcriptional regulator [Nitrococcus mobilis]EAR20931.1 transcriptional regulator, LysR family protein [Nitrococcus mobilis Nb-231]